MRLFILCLYSSSTNFNSYNFSTLSSDFWIWKHYLDTGSDAGLKSFPRTGTFCIVFLWTSTKTRTNPSYHHTRPSRLTQFASFRSIERTNEVQSNKGHGTSTGSSGWSGGRVFRRYVVYWLFFPDCCNGVFVDCCFSWGFHCWWDQDDVGCCIFCRVSFVLCCLLWPPSLMQSLPTAVP